MHLIFGLGNPGIRYRRTRHNVGFLVLEKLAADAGIELKQKSFNALWGKGKLETKNMLLVEPQTYMNLSGRAVSGLAAFFKADINKVIIIHDDLDLPFGTIRLKTGGGTAGHKGLESIAENLGSSDFMRVRIGIGKPADKARIDSYVLERFEPQQENELQSVIQCAADAVAETVLSGMQKAMVKYHKKNISNLKKEDK